MSVWAVVPHYGPPGPTLDLLEVLAAATVVPDGIVVVDNQGGLELDEDERVAVLRPGFNTGYGMAVERAADAALSGGADWLWVLNNDARPAADCLERLLEAGAADPRAGILSPLIRYRSGGDVWYAGGSVSPRTLDVRHLHEAQGAAPYATGFVTGCAPLLRAALVRELAPLDDGLFMYYEDVDWSLRALDGGWRLLVVPGAALVHDVHRERGRREQESLGRLSGHPDLLDNHARITEKDRNLFIDEAHSKVKKKPPDPSSSGRSAGGGSRGNRTPPGGTRESTSRRSARAGPGSPGTG